MEERPMQVEELAGGEGLSFEELDAQVGLLLPARVEMRRRRRRRRRRRGGGGVTVIVACNGTFNCNEFTSPPGGPSGPTL